MVKPKEKYKEEEEEEDEIKLIYNNLMWDKRIVRGNTYAAIVTSKASEQPLQKPIRRRNVAVEERELSPEENMQGRAAI